MQILMNGRSISQVKYFEGINETLFPEKDINETDRYLDGFQWREEERPRSKEDL